MGLKEVSRAIKKFVGKRRAYLEVSVGPPLARPMLLDEDTAAYPIGSLGNEANINFGILLLKSLGIPTDANFLEKSKQEGEQHNHLTAVVYAGLDNDEFEKALRGLSQRVDRCRALIGLYTVGEHLPILRFNWIEPNSGEVEFLPPRYRGIRERYDDDPISVEFIKTCATDHYEDDQLHYFISMIEQVYSLQDEVFRIARYFSLMEAMAGGITSQFVHHSGNNAMTRTAIRFMVGYFHEFDVPRFTITPNRDFEFDHIELAGQVRDKLFHGGRELVRDELPVVLRPGFDLLNLKPDMISHRLRRDCEFEIARWSRRESRGWLALNGTDFDLPVRDPNYDGRELVKPLVSASPAPRSDIISANVSVRGTNIGIVKFRLQI
jgi:hypothetical protein